MVGFPSVVDCKRSLEVIIMKLLIALKIIICLPMFWMCLFFEAVAIFQNFSGINSVARFLLRYLPKEKIPKEKVWNRYESLRFTTQPLERLFLVMLSFRLLKRINPWLWMKFSRWKGSRNFALQHLRMNLSCLSNSGTDRGYCPLLLAVERWPYVSFSHPAFNLQFQQVVCFYWEKYS